MKVAFAILCLLLLIWGWLAILTGCAVLQKKPDADVPDTPIEILYKTVYKTNWLVTLSIIGVAIATAAFVNGSKAALPIAMGSLAALGLTLATIRYAEWIALGSFVASILIFVATIIEKNIALKQLIVGIQRIKNLPVSKDAVNKLLTDVQNKDTTALVLKIKDALKLQGVI